MTTDPDAKPRFRRARKPEERTLRQEQILNAAAELLDEQGERGTGLNAIAARAGFTKSNVYRYFESREQVLLSLLLESFEQFLPQFEISIAMCPEGNTAVIARAVADGFLGHPRLAHLLAIQSSVLEHNVSEETIVALKRAISVQMTRIAFALHDKLPGTTLEDCAWVAQMVGTLIAGLWPTAHPSPETALVLTMPEFLHLKPAMARDLERGTLALLRSIDSRWLPADEARVL